MVVLWAALWLICLILFFADPKNEKIRWTCIVAFCGGCGGLTVLLGHELDRSPWILLLDGFLSSVGHYGTSYSILIFGVVFSDLLRTPLQKGLCKLLFFIPVIAMYFLYPIYPEFKADYKVLALWVTPYIVWSNILMIYSTWREKRPAIKRQKIWTSVVVVPMTSFALVTNILLEAFGIAGVWNYNPWIIGVQFLLFVYIAIRYGFLGVQVRVEKQRRDHTMRAVTSGTMLLNHAIKNEIAKIDLLANRVKDIVPENWSGPHEDIDFILHSTKHVLELSSRIQKKLDIMELKESEFWFTHCIEQALHLLKPHLDSKGTEIVRQYDVDLQIFGDPVHIQETCVNLINNALEAMNDGGTLLFKTYRTRRNAYLDITDSGKGIEKDNRVLVFDPFYTTKGKAGNYGLGLTYCYNVMQKHGGSITVKSHLEQGTTFTLAFPMKRIRSVSVIPPAHPIHHEKVAYGQN
ncbi:HAMP domain-containing histidine kinase [Paenibacillus mesophilus]|uniref:sensor histidine kinase n=1 Tax=Paenibacillus mesophilus TaxID=2582849 RepID=UPI00110E20D4|nr:HAMP domain-containing sensor histidine kinase [Paenibacillus mesophilus]TMV46256.1 HAMP domain-containing histidine kinase [Paenibacillus mesophilus]